MAENTQWKYPKLILDLILACVLGNIVFLLLWSPISPELSFPMYSYHIRKHSGPNQLLIIWGLPTLTTFSIQNYLSIFLAAFCGMDMGILKMS